MLTGYELYKTFPFGYNMKIIRSTGKTWAMKYKSGAHPESQYPGDSKILWFWTNMQQSLKL